MAKVRDIQASFVSGELDERMYGRVDTEIYKKGASRLKNVYVTPQGGAFRREGLRYVDATTGNAEARLISFEFNDEQTYVLVFTAGEFKVYRTDSSAVQATVSSSPVSSLTADQIKSMRFTQSADTLYLVHPDVQPIKITRTSDTAWTAVSVSFSNIPVYAFGSLTYTNPAGSVQASATTGAITLTGTGTSFDSSYEGQYINMPSAGRIFVKEVVSTTEISGVVILELPNTSSVSTGNWELESGYEDVVSATQGWFRSVAFFKGRLWFGGTKKRPQTLIASKIAQYEDLDVGSGLDDEAIDVTIDTDRANIIRDLFPGRGLQIFTSGGEFTIRSQVNDAVTPENIADQLRKETFHGSGVTEQSNTVRWPSPVSIDGATVFSEAVSGVQRQFVFNEVEQSYNANNISILSQHLLGEPVAMDIRRSVPDMPYDFLYVVNNEGNVAVLNSLREQDLLAWTEFTTEGFFEDVIVSGRKAYFVVKRTIDGSTVRHVEVLDPDYFMDNSVLQDNGSPTTSWSNLDNLEGETVSLRGDDYILNSKTVASGAIITDEDVSVLEAGMNFVAEVETLPVEVVIQGANFVGQFKTMVFVNTRLLSSRNIIVEYKGRQHKPNFRSFGSGVLDTPVSNYSGWKKVFVGGYNRDAQVKITQEEPLEFNIISLVLGVKV